MVAVRRKAVSSCSSKSVASPCRYTPAGHLSFVAFEEQRVYFAFQLLNLLPEGGLGNRHCFGCSAVVERLGKSQKIPKLMEIHDVIWVSVYEK